MQIYTPRTNLQRTFEDQNCKIRDCSFRHPRICKLLKSKNGCQRESDCDYLHDTLACEELNQIDDGDVKDIDEYPCQGCKTRWTNKNHVNAHIIRDMNIFFCLNCDEWIQNKSEVLKKGWTLFDKDGFWKRDVQVTGHKNIRRLKQNPHK